MWLKRKLHQSPTDLRPRTWEPSAQAKTARVERGTLATDGGRQGPVLDADSLDRVWTDVTEWCELCEQQRNLVFSSHIHRHHYLFYSHSSVFFSNCGRSIRGLLSHWAGNVGAWQPWHPRPLCLWLNCQTRPLITFFDGGLVVEEKNVGSKWLQEDTEGEKAKKCKQQFFCFIPFSSCQSSVKYTELH